jgi:hypothetical protein
MMVGAWLCLYSPKSVFVPSKATKHSVKETIDGWSEVLTPGGVLGRLYDLEDFVFV